MIVRYKPTGQLGEIPDDKFDPALFDKAGPASGGVGKSQQVQQPQQQAPQAQQPQKQSSGNPLGDLIYNLLSPARFAATGLVQAPILAASGGQINTRNIPVLGNILGSSDQELQKFSGNTFGERLAKTAPEGIRQGLDAASYAIPFGKTAKAAETIANPLLRGALNFSTKALIPGAATGLLQSASQEGATPQSMTNGIATGAATGGVFSLLGKGVGAVGKTIKGAGEDLGIRGFGLTSNDIGKIQTKTGMKIGDFLKKNGLMGKSADQVDEVIQPLQNDYNQIVQKSGLQVPVSGIEDAFDSKIKTLMASPLQALKSKGEELQTFLTNIKGMAPDGNIDLSKLHEIRMQADDLVTNFTKTGMDASQAKMIRDGLKKVIDTTSDSAGLTTPSGMKLSELGQKLSGLYTFSKLAGQRANKGVGTNPLGLTNAITSGAAGVGGSMVGGVPGYALGSILGSTAEKTINKPGNIRTLGRAGTAVGDKIQNLTKNGKMNDALQRILNIGVDKSVNGLSSVPSATDVSSNTNGYENNYTDPNQIQDSVHTSDNTSPQQQSQGADEIVTIKDNQTGKTMQVKKSELGQYGLGDQTEAGVPQRQITREQLTKVLLSSKIPDKLKNQVKEIYDYQEADIEKAKKALGGNKPLAATAQNSVNLANAGLRGLQGATDMYTKDPSLAQKQLVPGGLFSSEYDSALFRAVEGLLRARSGAAVPESEVRRYLSGYAPRAIDSKEVGLKKLKALQTDLQDIVGSFSKGSSQEDLLNQLTNQ